MILLPARTSQIVRLLMNSHSFSSRTLMETLHKNVEGTEVIEVLTPFSGGSIERKVFARLLRPADYVRNIEVPQIM